MKLEKITARGVTDLFRDVETGIIYFRKYRKDWGREIKRSTRTTDLNEAKKFAAEIYAKDKRKVAQAGQRKTAIELFDAWIERKKTLGKAPATITSIEASRKYLEPFFTQMMPEEITAEWWESEYIPFVKEKTHAERRFMNDRKWTQAFLKQLVEDRVLTQAPKLVNPDPRRSVGKVFTDEEIGLLLNYAQNEDLHLAILMASTMGMRRLEIFGLRADRVDLDAGVIRLKREDTKTRKARSFSISEPVLPFLRERVQAGRCWVFQSKADPGKPLHKDGYMTAWRNLKRIVGVEGRFHDLRHTFLTKAFRAAGANPALICHYAGLSLEVAERVYLHFTDEDTKQVAGLVKYE